MANNIIKTLAIMLMAMITGTACKAGENNGNDKKKSLTVVKLQHGINEAAEIHAAFDSRGVKWNEIDCLNWRKDYPYKPEAQFRIAHDGQNIYVEYHVKEDAVRAVNGNDQSAVFQDACCEFFLMLDGEDTYYNIESNCIGAILMQCGRQGGEREDASAAVLKGIKRWASLGKETFETRIGKQEWRLMLIIPAASLFQSSLPKRHFLSWNEVGQAGKPNFHQPARFGRMYFAEH